MINNQPKQIMLIDDDPFVTMIFETMVKNLGHQFYSINNGEEAFKYAHNPQSLAFTPDLLFIDYMLSEGYYGIDVVRRMRQNGYFETIPLFLFTACQDQKQYIDAVKHFNIAEVVLKPLSQNQLVEYIEKYTGANWVAMNANRPSAQILTLETYD